MPAWSKDWAGLKTVVFKSDNAAQGLPTIQASYLLIEQKTGRDRRHDGWRRDHPPAHRRGLGTCRRLSGAQGCHDHDAGGGRRAGRRISCAPMPPCARSAACSSTAARWPRPRRLPPNWRMTGFEAHSVTDLEARRAPVRHRQLRDDLDRAHRQGRMAEARHPCRSRRRLQAHDARDRWRGGGARLRLCRHARGRAGRSGRPAAGARRGQVRFRQHQGRSVRPLPGQGEGPRRRRTRSRCSSPPAPPSKTLPPPSCCIKRPA